MARSLDELIALTEADGLTLHWRDLGTRHGQYEPPRRIVLNPHRPETAQACTLAHELAHYRLGHTAQSDPVLHVRQEAAADRYAARLLISPAEYALAERLVGPSPGALAKELGVLTWVVLAYQDALCRA